MKNNVYTVKQVAKHLKFSEKAVIRLIHNRKIRASKGSYTWKIQKKI